MTAEPPLRPVLSAKGRDGLPELVAGGRPAVGQTAARMISTIWARRSGLKPRWIGSELR